MDISRINALLFNPSWDVMVVFAFIAIGFFYGVSAGKSKLISLLLSLYVSGFIFENFYYLGTAVRGKTVLEEFLLRASVFLVILVILSLLFSKIISSGYESGPRNWWKSFLLSFMSTGLLFSYLLHLFPVKGIFTFSPVIQNIFASDTAFFWWLVLPLVSLFVARK